jgi:hypothetical protein
LQRCIEEGIVLLVYSTSARRTFTELQSFFHKHLQHHAARALIIALHSETSVRAVPKEEGALIIALHSETSVRAVPKEEGWLAASQLKCRFGEASVSQPIRDLRAFQDLGREYMVDMRHGGVQEATDAWNPSYGSLVE